jgi:DNA-binding CsgD family transcriptional regulator
MAAGQYDESLRIAVNGARVPCHIASAALRTAELSPRELAVFELLGRGYDNRSLARALRISERTAKRHVTAILAKLGLESRLQAGLTALLGFLWPEGRMDPGVPSGDTGLENHQPSRLPGLALPYRTAEEGPMSFNPLDALREAGNPVDLLTEAQQGVFAQLSEDEVAVLNSIKRRLDGLPESEVEGHGDIKIL